MVRSGGEVIITDHRQPVARLVPFEQLGSLATLPAKGKFSEVAGIHVAPLAGKPIDSSAALENERGKR